LLPRDPAIRITAQKRNYIQSEYEVEYEQAGVANANAGWAGATTLLAMAAVFLVRQRLSRRE
jgi:hypothetical protein